MIRHLTTSDTLKETTDVAREQALDIEEELKKIEERLNNG